MKRRDFTGLSLLAMASLLSSGLFSSSKSFYVTITTKFPYPMHVREYRKLLPQWKDNDASTLLVNEMKKDKKILSESSSYTEDSITTCIEFSSKRAWDEYKYKFSKIEKNCSKTKEELGFHTTKEFKKTILS